VKVLHTFFFFFALWFSLILSILLLPFYYLLLPFSKDLATRYVYLAAHNWGRFVLLIAGVHLNVVGRDNMPPDGKFCIVANHQSYFDIPTLLVLFPYTLHFVAKKELLKIPFIRTWMLLMGCSFIDRKNRRKAFEVYNKEIKKINAHRTLILFPEGTRGEDETIGRFKPLALRRFMEADVALLPITIQGTYHCYEANRKIQSGIVNVHVHPVITELTDVEEIRSTIAGV
jgi:1-acyl-sn-glycerol-3-phosphate acyltransferase